MQSRIHFWLGVLLVQSCLWGLLLAQSGMLAPLRQPDTYGYEQTPWTTLPKLLGHMRTPGYGLFLLGVRGCGLSDNSIPVTQYAVYTCAVCLFWWGLARWSAMPGFSCAAASMLLYGNVVIRYAGYLIPDLLAASAGLALIGLLLESQGARLNVWRIVSMGLMVTLAWMLRPVYLFLVPLLPVLELVLIPVYLAPLPLRSNLWRAGVLACCGLVPVILWCGLRLAVLGDSAPVAFGGNHLVALACNFADESDTPHLSKELQPLWTDILRHRHELAAATREGRPLADWFADHPPELLQEAKNIHYSAELSNHYYLVESRFVLDIWSVCTPVAKQHVGNDWFVVDRTMRQLGNELIRQHRPEYARYCIKACVRGSLLTVTEQFLNWPHVVVLATNALLTWLRTRGTVRSATSELKIGMNCVRLLVGLGTLAGVFAATKVLAIAMTTPPITRMTDPAGMFWSTISACLLAMLLCRTPDTGGEAGC